MNDDPCIEETGEGPPLVLLHGWAMHGGVFALLVERLRERYRLYVVDLPGHGRSRDSAVPLALEACVEAIAAPVPRAPASPEERRAGTAWVGQCEPRGCGNA